MSEPTASVPAGWYPDPSNGNQPRWWDGTKWTEHVQQPYSTDAAALKAPEGTKTSQVLVWLMVLLPLVNLIGLFFIDWRGMFEFDTTDELSAYRSTFAIFASPAYVISLVLSLVLYGVNALLAYRDWRQLQALSVPRPFHFAWVFLSSPVYVIGRSVIVHRRTGKGLAPMWGQIAVYALSLGFGIYISATITSAITDQIGQLYR
jgi:hypothetical protein